LAFSEKEEGLKVVGVSSRSQGFYVGFKYYNLLKKKNPEAKPIRMPGINPIRLSLPR